MSCHDEPLLLELLGDIPRCGAANFNLSFDCVNFKLLIREESCGIYPGLRKQRASRPAHFGVSMGFKSKASGERGGGGVGERGGGGVGERGGGGVEKEGEGEWE